MTAREGTSQMALLTAKRFKTKAQGRAAHPGAIIAQVLQDPCQLAWQVNESCKRNAGLLARRFATLPACPAGERVFERGCDRRKDSFTGQASWPGSNVFFPAVTFANKTSSPARQAGRGRRGMTLIEILVVVGILMLLAAVTIPRLRPEIDKARIREAARSIHLYLSSAKAQAMATGRDCGILIEPLPAEAGASMQISQVEVPLPSRQGDFDRLQSATLTLLGATTNNNGAIIASCNVKLSTQASVTINPGDLIQVGYQGYWPEHRRPLFCRPPQRVSRPTSTSATANRPLG